jgi:hypothetical protein
MNRQLPFFVLPLSFPFKLFLHFLLFLLSFQASNLVVFLKISILVYVKVSFLLASQLSAQTMDFGRDVMEKIAKRRFEQGSTEAMADFLLIGFFRVAFVCFFLLQSLFLSPMPSSNPE